MEIYRGTRTPSRKTVLGAPSYTPVLPVALVWSAQGADPWSSNRECWKARFVQGSTVHAAELHPEKLLDIRSFGNHSAFSSFLEVLGYKEHEEGTFSHEEALRVYNYLHNRVIGKAKGGYFSYMVLDENGEAMDESEVPLSLRNPQTLISFEARDDFEWMGTLEEASRLIADTFIFADTPAIQKAARRLGYDCIVYEDVFAGGTDAAPELLNVEARDIAGIQMRFDIENELVPVHDTYRPLDEKAITRLWSRPAEEILHIVETGP